MEVDLNPESPTFGRIAYHSLVFREGGGTDFVQYDFDRKEKYRHQFSSPVITYKELMNERWQTYDALPWYIKLFTSTPTP